MNSNLLFWIVIAICALFAWQLWSWNLQSRTKRTKRLHNLAAESIKKTVGMDAYKVRNDRYTKYSEILNRLPIGKLTPAKKAEYDDLISSADYRINGKLRIAEEVHVKQWIYTGIYMSIVIVLGACNPVMFLGILAAPYAFKFPIENLRETRQGEVSYVMMQFRDFYNLYYAQFKRVGVSLRLQDIINSFKPMANEKMKVMLERIESDLGSGEEYALRQLDLRYPDNEKIHKFCILAGMVARGEGVADTALAAFRDQLEAQKRLHRKIELRKRKEISFTVCRSYIVVLLLVTVGVYLIEIIKGVRG